MSIGKKCMKRLYGDVRLLKKDPEMKLLKRILIFALGIFALKSDAQVADSSSYYLIYPKKKYFPDIYFKASVIA